MRPNVDIGWENHGTIKAIADARYDGDLDRAYNEVLKRGLQYSAIPGEERMEAGDIANVRFIPTEQMGEPFVFHRYLGRSANLYSVGRGPYTTFETDEIREHLATISRYRKVGVEDAAFGLRRSGGSWIGWGFGDFIEALSRPVARYRDTGFEELSREEAGLVFGVGGDYVILRGRHLPEQDRLGNVHLTVLAEGQPVEVDSSLQAVLGEFDAQLANTTKLSESTYTGSIREASAVEPIEYLTHMEHGQEWAHGLVIENPFRTGELHHDNQTVADPEQVVMYLSDHELMDEVSSSRYQITDYGITIVGVTNITLSGTWL